MNSIDKEFGIKNKINIDPTDWREILYVEYILRSTTDKNCINNNTLINTFPDSSITMELMYHIQRESKS